jgi:hypothetical protein
VCAIFRSRWISCSVRLKLSAVVLVRTALSL